MMMIKMIKESDQFSICTLKTNLPTIILVPHPGNMTSGYAFRNRPFERNPTTWVPTAPMRNGECLSPKRACTLLSRAPTQMWVWVVGSSSRLQPRRFETSFFLSKIAHPKRHDFWKQKKKRLSSFSPKELF